MEVAYKNNAGAVVEEQLSRLIKAKMKEKAEFSCLKYSARPVLRFFGPTNAVYMLFRRIYEHAGSFLTLKRQM